jgi:hypothetical protein
VPEQEHAAGRFTEADGRGDSLQFLGDDGGRKRCYRRRLRRIRQSQPRGYLTIISDFPQLVKSKNSQGINQLFCVAYRILLRSRKERGQDS